MGKKYLLFIISFILSVCALDQPASAQAMWQQTNGPHGGSAPAFELHRAPSGTVYAATLGTDTTPGAVYRSHNDGRSWSETHLTSLVATKDVSLITIGEGDLLLGLALTFNDTILGGFLRSPDGGDTWKRTGPEDQEVYDVTYGNEGIVLAGRERGVLRSSDGGTTWSPSGLDSTTVRVLWERKPGEFIAGTDAGLYRSFDNGNTWSFVNLPVTAVTDIITDPVGHIFVGTRDGIYTLDAEFDVVDELQGVFVNALSVRSSGDVFAATRTGVLRRSDSNEWIETDLELTVYSLAVTEGALLAATARGVYRSSNSGASWMLTGVPNASVRSLVFNDNNELLAGAEAGLFRSEDQGDSWTPTGLSGLWVSTLTRGQQGLLLAGATFFGGVYRSTDNGRSWQSMGLSNEFEIRSLLIDAEGRLYAGTDKSVYRSRDGGETWEPLDSGLSGRGGNALILDVNDDVLLSNLTGVFRYDKAASRWVKLPLEVSVNDLAVTQAGGIYAISYDRIYRSNDHGATWSQTGYREGPVLDVISDTAGNLFVGTQSSGIYMSSDQGQSWDTVGAGFPPTFCDPDISCSDFSRAAAFTLTIGPDGHLFVGTEWHGVVRSIEPIATEISNDYVIPDNPYTTAFPNPFNDAVNVRFSMTVSDHVEVEVFDALGRKIRVLHRGHLPAGEHEVRWEPDHLESGVYFCRLIGGGMRRIISIVHAR
ncbi:MAG: T9SS type A sorting domain-containing protein [Bacteroidetes bacterium]|jgi:photosystem II stability/assembly factor-like uncharacterized protein|nr:T9SS type A sorting domain-containing protein [Bacteroidota bacterium]